MVKEIIIHPELGKNRDGKEVQVGQNIEVRFKMKIVNDKLKYNNVDKKSDGYKITNGTYRQKSSGLSLSKCRGQPKKKYEHWKEKTVPIYSTVIEGIGTVFKWKWLFLLPLFQCFKKV